MRTKQRPLQQSSSTSLDSSPGFLSLDDNKGRSHLESDQVPDVDSSSKPKHSTMSTIKIPKIDGKKLVLAIISLLFLIIVYQSCFVDPENRFIQPDFADKFLVWVEENPGLGIGAIMIVIAFAVVTMVPIGTPLTLGCGYVYRGVYGWKMGIFVSTVVSMLGSCLGAVICFLLGRYLMRETVQQWVRKYPLFDAINIAAKEQGFKIMAMLYLTPVIPLGLVSYMCGTTSMNIYSFAFAKIFALPLYLIYTFMGASAHSFVKGGAQAESVSGISASDQAKKLHENHYLVISGLVLSIVMMTLISRHIRKELMKILDEQKKDKPGQDDSGGQPSRSGEDSEDIGMELGLHPRRRGAKAEQAD